MRILSYVFGLILSFSCLAQDWQALGGGANSQIRDIWVDTLTNELYVCGDFTEIGGIPSGGVAKWDGSSWTDLCSECSGSVYSILKFEGKLYIGGLFFLNNIRTYLAELNGSTWQESAVLDQQTRLQVFESELYLKGFFETVNGDSISKFAKWNGTEWEQALDSYDLCHYLNFFSVTEIVKYNDSIVMGGNFSNGTGIIGIAVYDGGTWLPLGDKGFQLKDLIVYKDILYLAVFLPPLSQTNEDYYIVAWDGENFFNPFPNVVFTTPAKGLDIIDDELYILGTYEYVNDPKTYLFAKFDGENFCSFGGSYPTYFDMTTPSQKKMVAYNNELITIGSPYLFNDTINNIGKWMQTEMDTCINNPVHLSVKEKVKDQVNFQVYPNPTTGSFDLDLSQLKSDRITIQIFDASGRNVFDEEVSTTTSKTIIETHLQNGVYVLKLETDIGIFEQKLLIQ